jgi:hypothetical protein
MSEVDMVKGLFMHMEHNNALLEKDSKHARKPVERIVQASAVSQSSRSFVAHLGIACAGLARSVPRHVAEGRQTQLSQSAESGAG